MRYSLSVPLGALTLAAGAFAQDVFETPDFNVTEALIANGVNVSALAGLSSFPRYVSGTIGTDTFCRVAL